MAKSKESAVEIVTVPYEGLRDRVVMTLVVAYGATHVLKSPVLQTAMAGHGFSVVTWLAPDKRAFTLSWTTADKSDEREWASEEHLLDGLMDWLNWEGFLDEVSSSWSQSRVVPPYFDVPRKLVEEIIRAIGEVNQALQRDGVEGFQLLMKPEDQAEAIH